MTASKPILARKASRAAAVLAIVSWQASVARAEPTVAEKETARGLMAEGRTLRENGDDRGALRYFQAADAIMHVPTTALEIARTQIALGLYLEARESLRHVKLSVVKADDPVPFREARVAAESLDAELDKLIGAITIEVTGVAPGAKVTVQVDDVIVPEAAAMLPFRVNPGSHSVVAASRAARMSQSVDVPKGATTTVTLDLSPASVANGPSAAGFTAPPRREAGSSGLPTLAYVGFTASAAGLLVGSVTGAMSIANKSSAEGWCVDHRCPPEVWGKLDKAQSLATAANVSFIVAGLGAGAGVVALLLRRSDRTDVNGSTATVRVVPTLGGVAAFGRF